MNIILRVSILLISTIVLGCESAESTETARKVGAYLNATGVIPPDNKDAYTTHVGKIVYVGPGINGYPHFTYYEVTAEADMEKLELAAEESLKHVPEAKKITLHFMEKQVLQQLSGGGVRRGSEKEIRKIFVKR